MIEVSQLSFLAQSIHQISMGLISLAKTGSVAQQPNRCSTAKSMKQFPNINGPSGTGVYVGKAKVKRCVLKVATEMAE